MDLSRRHLLRSSGALAGVLALGGLADRAVAGTTTRAAAGAAARAAAARTTLDSVVLPGAPGKGGWRPLVRRAGEPHTVREGLGTPAKAGRKARREALLAFVQLSDVHVLDAQSPMRFENFDVSVSSSAYRPQEVLTAHVADAMVRTINKVAAGPVTGLPLALALQTGDNSDNGQYNEIRWNIDVLDGGQLTVDSGDMTKYEGVMDGNPDFYDPYFWHPHGTPSGLAKDLPRKKFGFPRLPGLLDTCREPFDAAGLSIPWIVALGNHDELMQGNFPHLPSNEAIAVGSTKQTSKGPRTVSADPDRRLLSRAETVEEHFVTTGAPVGHGFTETNRTEGTAYYTFDQGLVRFVVLDSVNENGGDDGSLGAAQFAWLQAELAAATDRLVVVASHHTSWTMDNDAPGAEARILGDAVVAELVSHDHVIAWVNGHTHRNVVRPHKREGGGGFWEINTAAHIDWPQQARLIEVTDNKDGSVSIFCTMLDHAAPLNPSSIDGPARLAGWSRLLAANDWQERDSTRRGTKAARNVELLCPAPAFLG